MINMAVTQDSAYIPFLLLTRSLAKMTRVVTTAAITEAILWCGFMRYKIK